MRRPKLYSLMILGLPVALLAGCVSGAGSNRVSPSRAADPEAALRDRATQLWAAKVNQDWETIFQFEDPNTRREWDKDEFVEWSQQNDPFKIQSFEVGKTQADGTMGWVEVNYRTLIRRFESLPPRDAKLWQKWRKVNGEWHPVPLRELVAYPEPPARRNAVEEARLRERFMQSWLARKEGDHARLYQLVEPHDQPKMPEEAYVDMQSLLKYLSCDVKWVEVVGRLGRVHVVYERKVTDPSLSKLPIERAVETEDWIKVDGEWYRDLARAVGPTPGETDDAS